MHTLIQKASKPSVPYHFFILMYVATLLFSFHYYFVTYINSSFLSGYVSDRSIGMLYAAGSILSIILFFAAVKSLQRFGNYRMMLFFIAIEGLILLMLAFLDDASLIVPVFIIHHAINPILLLSLDIFLERSTDNETTGSARGIFLTVFAVAAAISPVIVGFVVSSTGSFSGVYLASLGFNIVLFLVVYFYFRNYKDVSRKKTDAKSVFLKFLQSRPIRQIFFSYFILQVFYSWMIVYAPVYLFRHVGLEWTDIGLIISISILPFVFFEFPLGRIADKKIGEKEILLSGFLIMILGACFMSQFSTVNLLVWIFVFTFARIGASFVEAAVETYFFKHIDESNAELVDFWRMGMPLGFIVGTTVGSVALIALSYRYIFLVLAAMLCVGFYYATKIKDTK